MGNGEDSTDLIQDVGGFNMSYESYDHIFWNEDLLYNVYELWMFLIYDYDTECNA